MIAIRKATPGDMKHLLRLWKALMDYHARPDFPLRENAEMIIKKFIARDLKSKNSIVLIAMDGRKAVGYLMGLVKKFPPVYTEARMGYISDGFVMDRYRGKGIMGKMLREAKGFFIQKRMKHIFLRAETSNITGIESWQYLGFKEEAKEMFMDI